MARLCFVIDIFVKIVLYNSTLSPKLQNEMLSPPTRMILTFVIDYIYSFTLQKDYAVSQS